ncbi:hypothetical protein CSHISOI_01045 [Colletotrichum shisoi]|uniref:Uncharacterized protein n=1 Tax=Colletotrichum shisoi TaxID=2078593 RepID=A0A5Q4C6S5_9PEZI|nr:hypothetical protein CSHISOI_01045 [Colletotrichum shisoi]
MPHPNPIGLSSNNKWSVASSRTMDCCRWWRSHVKTDPKRNSRSRSEVKKKAVPTPGLWAGPHSVPSTPATLTSSADSRARFFTRQGKRRKERKTGMTMTGPHLMEDHERSRMQAKLTDTLETSTVAAMEYGHAALLSCLVEHLCGVSYWFFFNTQHCVPVRTQEGPP